MSKNIDIGSKTLDIVLLLFRKQKLHVRQIARDADISATTASTLLKNLRNAGIVELEVLGKNCFYSLKKSIAAKKIAAMAENKKAVDILASNNELNNTMQETAASIAPFNAMIDFAIVTNNEPLMIVFVTTLDEAEILRTINAAEEKINQNINVRTFTKREFEENRELPADYFVLFGTESFVDFMLR